MSLIYKYAIEEKWTTIETIGISKDFYKNIIYNEYNLIEKSVKKEGLFKFKYVGIIVYKDEILLILPKYYNCKTDDYNKIDCIKQLISVFKKLPKTLILKHKDSLILSGDVEDEYISEFAIADYLIKDFIKNGYYTNDIIVSKLNTKGKIDWNKTINKIQPITSNGYPIYAETYSLNKINNNNDSIRRIHKAVLSICIEKYAELLCYKITSKSLKQALSTLKQLGGEKRITTLVKNELQSTYNDRDIRVLKCIHNFFNKSKNKSKKTLSLYGTTSFEIVWEFICGYIFNNEYEKFKKDIPSIKWQAINGKEVENSLNNLKPDIIKMQNQNILLVDAKYYSINLTKNNVNGNPGSYDIVKQYTYEMLLKTKYKNYELINLLVYPKETDINIKLFGYVSFEAFKLKPILNFYLSPKYAFNLYLNEKRLDKNEFNYIIGFR